MRWPIVGVLLLSGVLPTARAVAQKGERTVGNGFVDVRFTPGANLAYQLDCVSGVVPFCGRADYEALWRTHFLRTAVDSLRLRQWEALNRRYAVSIAPTGTGDDAREPMEVGQKLRLAQLQSSTPADLLVRLELLLAPADWLIAREVVLHFAPPFDRWWRETAAPTGEPFVQALRALLHRSDVAERVGQFVRFYGTTYPLAAGVPMQLLLRPGLVSEGTSGQQIERHAMLEFFADESPASRIDVAVHELCHFLFSTRSSERATALGTRMRQSPIPGAVAAFNLLNEGLATALGNGVLARAVLDSARWQRRLDTPLSFYNNPHIDRAARVLLPLVDSALARGETLDTPSFVDRYVAGVDSAFGASATSPALLLNELYLFVDASLGDSVRRVVRRAIRPSSMYADQTSVATATFGDFTRQPALSALLVVTPGAMRTLVRRGIVPSAGLRTLIGAPRGADAAVQVARRPSGSYLFVITARDGVAATAMVDRLAAMSTIPTLLWRGSPLERATR